MYALLWSADREDVRHRMDLAGRVAPNSLGAPGAAGLALALRGVAAAGRDDSAALLADVGRAVALIDDDEAARPGPVRRAGRLRRGLQRTEPVGARRRALRQGDAARAAGASRQSRRRRSQSTGFWSAWSGRPRCSSSARGRRRRGADVGGPSRRCGHAAVRDGHSGAVAAWGSTACRDLLAVRAPRVRRSRSRCLGRGAAGAVDQAPRRARSGRGTGSSLPLLDALSALSLHAAGPPRGGRWLRPGPSPRRCRRRAGRARSPPGSGRRSSPRTSRRRRWRRTGSTAGWCRGRAGRPGSACSPRRARRSPASD